MNQTLNKSKYTYEFATESDGEEISALLEQTSFKGDFELVYAKRPNAYFSINRDGEKNAIVIARNSESRKIVGVGICIINEMVVANEVVNVGYLCGLRVDENSTVNIFKSYKMLQEFCNENNVKYTYTTILPDNSYAIKMLTKKRKSMPLYVKHSDYAVHIIRKNLKFKSKYKCLKAMENDFDKLLKFIQSESKNKEFFPNLTAETLKHGFFGLTYEDFYLLKNDNDEILCCGILWNQGDYKQLVLKRYSFKYKILKFFASIILKILKYPKPPEENEVIKYLTLSFVLSKNDNPDSLNDFIKQVSNNIAEECEFFVYGSTTDSVQSKKIQKISAVNYKSYVYLIDWDKTNQYEDLLSKNIYIECGLL